MLPIGIVALLGFGSAALALYKDTQGSQVQGNQTYRVPDVSK